MVVVDLQEQTAFGVDSPLAVDPDFVTSALMSVVVVVAENMAAENHTFVTLMKKLERFNSAIYLK